ncbi:MAG TPA: hypothetical protein VH120_15395 [Gemmataceae bacterium]|nr:hypothetical protein [Gemmataceae bacterium]
MAGPKTTVTQFAPDGKTIAVYDADSNAVWIWDIPPRRSLLWLAVGAGVLGLLVAWFARRQDSRISFWATSGQSANST